MAELTTPWPDAAPTQAQPLESLEGRLQHLEVAVAALQDTEALEDRVAERVSARLQSSVAGEAERMVAADRRAAATAVMSAAGDAFRAVATPVGQQAARVPWLMVDLYLEIFAVARMFFDLQYRVGWTTRLLVLVLVPLILTSHWWVPFAHLPVLGVVLDKLVDLGLAFVVVKALSREARRYLEFRTAQGKL